MATKYGRFRYKPTTELRARIRTGHLVTAENRARLEYIGTIASAGKTARISATDYLVEEQCGGRAGPNKITVH